MNKFFTLMFFCCLLTLFQCQETSSEKHINKFNSQNFEGFYKDISDRVNSLIQRYKSKYMEMGFQDTMKIQYDIMKRISFLREKLGLYNASEDQIKYEKLPMFLSYAKNWIDAFAKTDTFKTKALKHLQVAEAIFERKKSSELNHWRILCNISLAEYYYLMSFNDLLTKKYGVIYAKVFSDCSDCTINEEVSFNLSYHTSKCGHNSYTADRNTEVYYDSLRVVYQNKHVSYSTEKIGQSKILSFTPQDTGIYHLKGRFRLYHPAIDYTYTEPINKSIEVSR